jgi:hypothetical protein
MQPHPTELLDGPAIAVPSIELWLPSNIGKRVHWDKQFGEHEWVLRQAQARDALNSIRHNLRLRDFLMKEKKKWSRGVRENTRSQSVIDQSNNKIRGAKTKYSMAHTALTHLAPLLNKDDSWSSEFQELKDSDVQSLPAEGWGEGRRSLSWIWMVPGVADGTDRSQPQLTDGK